MRVRCDITLLLLYILDRAYNGLQEEGRRCAARRLLRPRKLHPAPKVPAASITAEPSDGRGRSASHAEMVEYRRYRGDDLRIGIVALREDRKSARRRPLRTNWSRKVPAARLPRR